MFWIFARTRRREPRPRAHAALAIFLALSFAACAAPDRPLPPVQSIEDSVRLRAHSPEALALALELVDVGPLDVEKPTAPTSVDATRDEFWHASAYAYNPEVRAARRKLLADRARATSAGAPGPIMTEIEPLDLSGANEATDVNLTFDLLGLLGIGPSARAKELANVEALQSLSELESAVWRARFTVDRARIRVSAARAREAALAALLEEAEHDRVRISRLAERGWLPASHVEWSWAIQHMIEARMSEERVSLFERRRELAIASGLSPRSPALESVPPLAVEGELEAATYDETLEPGADELFKRVPSLRAMRWLCALAEANLRLKIAETWPDVRIGPRALFTPEVILTGAKLDLSFIFPGAKNGEIEAAEQECERMREAVEDAYLAAIADLDARTARLGEVATLGALHVEPMDRAAELMWQGARARFAIDANTLEGWSFALEHRVEPLIERVDAREELALARLDVAESRGFDRAEVTP